VLASDSPGGLVRPAVLQDAPAIAAVHVATWRDAYAGLLPDDFLDGLDVDQRAERWRGRLAALPAGLFVLVVELDGDCARRLARWPAAVSSGCRACS
jgi:hypothetical protein